MPLRAAVLAFALLAASLAAQAGRPVATDDASILDAGRCQVETWYAQDGPRREGWLLPACRVLGMEIAAGGSAGRSEGASVSLYGVQVKTAWDLESLEGIALGAVGNVQRHHDADERSTEWNALGIVTWRSERLAAHVNLGWTRAASGEPWRGAWRIAGEGKLSERVEVALESFGQKSGRPTTQASARYVFDKGRWLDASWGRPRDGEGWGPAIFTAGLHYEW